MAQVSPDCKYLKTNEFASTGKVIGRFYSEIVYKAVNLHNPTEIVYWHDIEPAIETDEAKIEEVLLGKKDTFITSWTVEENFCCKCNCSQKRYVVIDNNRLPTTL